MKKLALATFVLLLLGLWTFTATAQFKNQGMGGGIGFGGTVGQTEFKDSEMRFLTRAFLRLPLAGPLYGEVGAGLGRIAGVNTADASMYTAIVVPIDYRFVLRPFSTELWAPYLYAGAGAIYGEVTERPTVKGMGSSTTMASKFSGWGLVAPGGLGMLFKISDLVAFDLSGGYNYTLKEDLEGVKNGKKDGYFNFLAGLTYSGEGGGADPDQDGLTNDEEKALGTDAHKADTDGDGLSDGEEINKYHTGPLKMDSDGDGLSDDDEILKYRTDPNKADSDGDGLADGDEITKYHTDPLKADTDGDGLSDADEVTKYHTDALKMDTDGDNLSDADEILKHHTDPLKADTDGGTVGDGVELARGSNPLDPADDIPKPAIPTIEVGKAIVLEGIVFQSGKAAIQPESESTLEQALSALQENPSLAVEIRGYTDNVGKAAVNKTLSLKRAEAVKSWLVKKGIDATRIAAKGFGPADPISDNKTPEGRAKNRRIEFFRTK